MAARITVPNEPPDLLDRPVLGQPGHHALMAPWCAVTAS